MNPKKVTKRDDKEIAALYAWQIPCDDEAYGSYAPIATGFSHSAGIGLLQSRQTCLNRREGLLFISNLVFLFDQFHRFGAAAGFGPDMFRLGEQVRYEFFILGTLTRMVGQLLNLR